MNILIENFLDEFISTYPDPFSADEISALLQLTGFKIKPDDISEILDADPRVFSLQKKQYLTRAGAFTGSFFSFVPMQQEIEQGVFVPGDRFIPFVNFDELSFSLNFRFKEKNLSKKPFKTDCNTARDLFCLYGDEFSAQYINSDPACKSLHIAENNFELPFHLTLTGVSLEPILAETDFKYGDRIVCRLIDWQHGIIDIEPVLTHKLNPFQIGDEDIERQKWYDCLERALLDSFDRIGPCSGIEEQLANVFYEERNTLCVPSCGSVHEFLDKTKSVSLELFGVETRLWRKGEDVPAVGKWNKHEYEDKSGVAPFFALPDFIIDCYLKDQLYAKKDDSDEIVKKIIPENILVSEEERTRLKLQIERRNAIIRRNYNWFADFANGSIRHRALELFSQVSSLVCELDCNDKELRMFPQQELVTLSQLYTHISRILEMLSSDTECGEDESYAMQISIEGMEMNFEDLKPIILSELEKVRKSRFNVI